MRNTRRARTPSPPPSLFARRRESSDRVGRDPATRGGVSVTAMTTTGGGGAAAEPLATLTTAERRTRLSLRTADRAQPQLRDADAAAATDTHDSRSSHSISNSTSNVSVGVLESSPSAIAALASRLNATAAASTTAISPGWLAEASGGGGGRDGQGTPATFSINAPVGAGTSAAAKRILPPPPAPRRGSAPAPEAARADTAATAPLARGQRRGRPPPPPLRCDALNASALRSSSCPSSRSATAVGPPAAGANTRRPRTPPSEARGSSGSASGGAASGGRVSPLTGAPAAVSVTHLPAGATARSTAEPPPLPLPHTSPALAFQPLGLWRGTAHGRTPASPSATTTAARAVPMGATTLDSPVAPPPRAPAAAARFVSPNTSTAATSAPAVLGASGSDVSTLLTYEVSDSAVVIVDADAVPDDLVCGVCMSVCRQPTATTCGHLFCRRCLQTWMRTNPETAMCPLDRTPLVAEQLHTDARAQRQINALRCRCPASLPRTAQLELRGMTVSASAADASQDDAVRAAADEPCAWRGCISDAAAHLRQCPHLITACPFAVHGCTAQLTRAQMAQHVKDDVAAHLLLVSQALIASTTQCRLLQEEVDVLRRRCTMRGARGSLLDDGDDGEARVGHEGDDAAAPHVRTTSLVLPATSSPHLSVAPGGSSLVNVAGAAGMSTGAMPEDTSMTSGSLPRVVSPFSQTHPAHLPVYHPLSPIPLGPPMNAGPVAPRTVHPAVVVGAPGGVLPRAPHGVADYAAPVDVAVSPLRTPSPLQAGADPFVWAIANVAELQAPCYSRVFTAHGLPWYVGIDTAPSWEQCGVYLFAEGHDRRVDFRVVLFHDDRSRDIVHVVRDWREDYIGKGWGPLRFINRFRLEQAGFLARGCLRIGIEVISDPY